MNKVSVIMTCRNEEENIEKTLNALEKQTVAPNEVIIIDDGSTDKTFEIIQEFSIKNDWILHRKKGDKDRYWSIVNGLKTASSLLKQDYEYLMVLDADTILESQYIQKILEKFESTPNLGIAGGWLKYNGKRSNEFLEDKQIVFGCNRVYSKKCWEEINEGKLVNVSTIAWDPEHSLRATVRGYDVKRFDDVTSTSIRPPSMKLSSFVNGTLCYQFGYGFSITLISCIFHRKFKFLGGFISAWFKNKRKIDNQENIKIIKNNYSKEFWKRKFKKGKE